MMDDVIKLISTGTPTYDEYGNEILSRTERQVFCIVNSVNRTEFYQAAQNDLQPEYIFVISHYKDYEGEKELLYTDWTGTEKTYSVIRTYRNDDSIELTAVERIGNRNEASEESE